MFQPSCARFSISRCRRCVRKNCKPLRASRLLPSDDPCNCGPSTPAPMKRARQALGVCSQTIMWRWVLVLNQCGPAFLPASSPLPFLCCAAIKRTSKGEYNTTENINSADDGSDGAHSAWYLAGNKEEEGEGHGTPNRGSKNREERVGVHQIGVYVGAWKRRCVIRTVLITETKGGA